MSTSAPNTTILHPSTTIDHIPPEILSRICYFNTYRDWSSLHENDTSPNCILWPAISDTVRASHVCRRWRDILISSPDLWVNIDPKNPEFARVMLERSHPYGIKLVAPTTSSETVVSCQDIRSRLVECHLTDDRHSPFWENSTPIFPRLRFLYLNIQNLPGNFPGLATPVLERLCLRTAFAQDPRRFGVLSDTLTHFAIVGPSRRIEIQKLIIIINQLRNLQSLTLCEALCESLTATVPGALKQIHVLNFSLRDPCIGPVLQFFHHAELTRSLQSISLDVSSKRGWGTSEHLVSKAMDAFNVVCSPGAFERCKLSIGSGEITYTGLPDFKPSPSRQPEQRKFHLHYPSGLTFKRLFLTLPAWSYDRVEHLTIHFPVINALYGELREDVIVGVLRRFLNVRVLGGVGQMLWSILYRWSHPLDNDKRLILPSLCEVVLHRGRIVAMSEACEDVGAPVSDSDSKGDEEDTEGGEGDVATASVLFTDSLPPESDSGDDSYIYQSSHSDHSDFEDSTEFVDTPEFLEFMRGKQWDDPECYEEFIDRQEIVEFCSNRPLIRNFIISCQTAQDDKCCSDLRLALGELGVLLETRSGPTK